MKKIPLTHPSYRFTLHLRQRYTERILKRKFIGYLHPTIDKELINIFRGAIEDKSWVNNLNIVHHIYKKYGKSPHKFLKNGDTVFVCVQTDIKNVFSVVTCYNADKNQWGKRVENKIDKIIDIKNINK